MLAVLLELSVKHDIAIDVPHHLSKGLADPGNANRGRGASSMKDAVRLAYTLSPMSAEEAKVFGLSEDERSELVRLDSGKVNIVRRTYQATWFRLVGVPLGNATAEYPDGDNVQAIEPWTPPDIWLGMTDLIINAILDDIDTGMVDASGVPDGRRYSAHPNADARAAWRVVVRHCPGKLEGAAKEIIRKWVETGVLIRTVYRDPVSRKDEKGLDVDDAQKDRPRGRFEDCANKKIICAGLRSFELRKQLANLLGPVFS